MDDLLETQLMAAKWSPDRPDFRDLTLTSEEAKPLMAFVDYCQRASTQTDLSERIPVNSDCNDGSAVAANACCTLMEYFLQNCGGDPVRLSRTFVHRVSRLMALQTGEGEVSLRSVFKCLRMFGAPPVSLVKHLESQGKQPEDSPICFQYNQGFSDVQYFRLDDTSPELLIVQIQRLLNAGIPMVFGMGLPSSFGMDCRVDLRADYDSVVGYTAGLIVGHDDAFRMSTLGAFNFQSGFSKDWGVDGVGWVSYELFRQGLVTDVWTAMHPSWLLQLADDHGYVFDEDCFPVAMNNHRGSHAIRSRAPKEFPGRNRRH